MENNSKRKYDSFVPIVFNEWDDIFQNDSDVDNDHDEDDFGEETHDEDNIDIDFGGLIIKKLDGPSQFKLAQTIVMIWFLNKRSPLRY